MKAFLIFCFVYLMINITIAQEIDITITNIRNSEGNILLSFYKNPDSFPYNAYMRKFVSKEKMIDGTIKASLNGFEHGKYAISLLDDENEDKDMNYRFFIPREGYGFSNYVHKGLLPPDFNDCSFSVIDGSTEVLIQVKYW